MVEQRMSQNRIFFKFLGNLINTFNLTKNFSMVSNAIQLTVSINNNRL